MERILHIAGLGVIAAVIAMVVMNALKDPMANRRQAFAEQMDQIPLTPALRQDEELDATRLRVAVAAKPKLWDALVEEVVVPPPPPKPPDLLSKLKGVVITRQSVGDKVKVMLPKNNQGVWVAKGEEIINGCKLKDFDKFNATVSFYWAYNKEELTIDLTRK